MTNPPGQDVSDVERRRAPRPRVLLGGKLVFGNATQSADCTIRDLSETGARVRIAPDLPIGGEVWLISITGGLAWRSQTAWRRANELGLHFLEQVDLKTPLTGSLGHLRRLWLDCAGR
ncbi:MAG TPA: PilZ domain-containing protein [Caulobacteraceae bacterium]|jgi:two-component system cell cycle response regulator|nr:PilZ domain-containing protein [Caulobacteraceae bacterium]